QRLLDRVTAEFNVQTPTELSRRLNIPRSTIDKVQKGEATLNWLHRLTLLDKIGFATARNMMLKLVPERIAERATELTNVQFRNIGEARFERALENDDANLLQFVLFVPELKDSPRFKENAGLDDELLERIVPNGELTPLERARIIEALVKENGAKWAFDFTRLRRYITSSTYLLNELQLIEFPSNDRAVELAKGLINALEKHAGGPTDLAEELNIDATQISQLKSGKLKLNLRIRFKILDYIERKMNSAEHLNFGVIDELANNPEKIQQVLDDLDFPRQGN
ncbi:hypothetical protein, partial [Oleiphilus sp. HI0079]|uniref:hypothetical protein n=1 Tax=Oleiphilus sp. HI0079 TaxID=1822254 RepID=UPI000ACEDB52